MSINNSSMMAIPVNHPPQGIFHQPPMFEPVPWPVRCRIWVYVSNRAFETHEQSELAGRLSEFTANWSAHKLRLSAYSTIFLNQVIVLGVDEQIQSVSGCSIDSSVSFLKDCEAQWKVVLLDGGRLARYEAGCLTVESVALARQQVEKGVINPHTWFFNSFAHNIEQLRGEPWLRASNKLFSRMLGI
jgi:hypothetical protein